MRSGSVRPVVDLFPGRLRRQSMAPSPWSFSLWSSPSGSFVQPQESSCASQAGHCSRSQPWWWTAPWAPRSLRTAPSPRRTGSPSPPHSGPVGSRGRRFGSRPRCSWCRRSCRSRSRCRWPPRPASVSFCRVSSSHELLCRASCRAPRGRTVGVGAVWCGLFLTIFCFSHRRRSGPCHVTTVWFDEVL